MDGFAPFGMVTTYGSRGEIVLRTAKRIRWTRPAAAWSECRAGVSRKNVPKFDPIKSASLVPLLAGQLVGRGTENECGFHFFAEGLPRAFVRTWSIRELYPVGEMA